MTINTTGNSGRVRARVCLETSVLAGIFNLEAPSAKICRDIVSDATQGRIECFVSALALIECEPAGADGDCQKVADFFESEFLTRCNVDPFNAELARRLREEITDGPVIEPHLWLWIATALLEECNYLMTYNKKLLKLNGHTSLGKLEIVTPARPWDAGQLSLEDIEGVTSPLAAIDVVTRRSITI